MSPRRSIKLLLLVVFTITIAALGIAIASGWSSRVTGALGFLFGAMAVVVAAVLSYIAAISKDPPDLSATESMAVDRLDREVGRQWREERERRHLADTVPVEVKFRAVREGPLGVDPVDLLRADGDPTDIKPRLMDEGTLDALHDLYLKLPRRRIVIIGDGGTGKTAALILLIIRATSQRDDHPENPVPVLLTAADWDPDPVKGQHLAAWVAATIYDQHPYLSTEQYGGRVVERLLESGRISLFLDGLDEMSDEHRSMALQAVGTETRFRIVVTSRPGEVEAAVAAGGFPGGVEFVCLQHVPPNVGGAWLRQDQPAALRSAWARVARAMNRPDGGALARALDTPLWLSLARSCYRVSDAETLRADSPAELLDERRFADEKQIRSHLLDRTIEQELEFTRYADHGRRYLASFAQRFEPVGFNWWRIRDMAPRLPVAVTVVTCGIAAGVAVGFVSGTLDGIRFGSAIAVSGMFVGWLVVAMVGRGRSGRLRGPIPRQCTAIALGLLYGGGISAATRLASRHSGPAFALAAGAGMGILLGIAVGLVALHDGPMLAAKRYPSRRDLLSALLAGAACTASASIAASPWRALVVGITALTGFAGAVGLTRPDDIPGANMGPMQSYRADLRGSLMFGLIGGTAIGIGSAIGIPHDGLLAAAVIGAGSGLAIGAAGTACSSQAVALASIGLWLRLTGGRGPIAVVPFLEFARERNLIRVAGTAYQFRHRELREYLIRESDA